LVSERRIKSLTMLRYLVGGQEKDIAHPT